MPSIFHHTESNFDLIATIKYLEKEWCHSICIIYSWVKGHADCMNRPLTRNERLNMKADAIADQIWNEARGPRRARPQCNHWEIENLSLSIGGVKRAGHMKQKLWSPLHDGDMMDYLILKEEWKPLTLNDMGRIWDRIMSTVKKMLGWILKGVSQLMAYRNKTPPVLLRNPTILHLPRPNLRSVARSNVSVGGCGATKGRPMGSTEKESQMLEIAE
jgi:hypothetical protein